MLKNDSDYALGWLIGLAIIFAIVVYIVFIVATFVATAAAAGGTLFGGGSAIKNYYLSFKENVVDSNFSSSMVA